jgi:hypothetical protein
MPAAPKLRTPANNATVSAANIRFEWTKSLAPEKDGLTFRHCLWNGDQLYDFNRCTVVAENWSPGQADWLTYAIIAALALLLMFILLVTTGARLLIVVLLSFAVALWAGWQVHLLQTGRAPGSNTVEKVAPGKIYYWRVVAEDAEGNLVESETRRLVVK